MRLTLVSVLVIISASIVIEASSISNERNVLVRPKRTLHLLQAMLNAFAPPPAKVPVPPMTAQPKMDRLPPPPPPAPPVTKPPPPPPQPAPVPSSFFSNFPSFGFAKFNFFVTPFNTFPPQPDQPPVFPAPPAPPATPAPPAVPAPALPDPKMSGPSKFALPIPRSKPTPAPTTPQPAPTEPQSTLPPATETTLIPEANPKLDSNASEDDDDSNASNASTGDPSDSGDNSLIAPGQLWRSSLFDAAEGPADEAAGRFTGGFFGDSSNQFLRFDDNTDQFYNPRPELQFRRAASPHFRPPKSPMVTQHHQEPAMQHHSDSYFHHQAQTRDFGRTGAAHSSVKMHDNNFNYVTYHNGPAMMGTTGGQRHDDRGGVQTQYFGKRSAIY